MLDKFHKQTMDLSSTIRAGLPVVIHTNLGWTRQNENVMGAGLAKIAKEAIPELPRLLGAYYQLLASWDTPRKHAGLVATALEMQSALSAAGITIASPPAFANNLIFFPTKDLDRAKPHLSWQSPSSLWIITLSLGALAAKVRLLGWGQQYPIRMPLPGTGNGRLSEDAVAPLVETALTGLESRFVIVEKP